MSARAIWVGGAALAFIALASCGNNASGDKTDQSSAERVAAALDVCAEGRGAFAQRLCENRTLANLDAEVRETLVAQAANVSDAGAQMLVQNQNRWLDAQRVACGIADPEAQPTEAQQTCIASELRARADEARTAVQDIGGYTFQRMELVDATPAPASIASVMGDGAPAAVVRDIRFPRIDGEQTPEIRRFNELVAQQPQFGLEDATNESVDYAIAYAGPELISVRFNVSQDTLGAANAANTMKAVTVVMSEGRPLTAEDVFQPDSGWQDFITDRAVAAIAREFSDYSNFPPRRDVFETATKPHLWLVTERALILLFPPLSFGGSHVDGGTEVSIPWAELRPYLNPAAPAPIRPNA
ncbi:MAG: hypothetical protein AB7O98_02385 [Hyphomonadaceae bacterium]